MEIEIPDELDRRLTQYAQDNGISKDEVIREAILSRLHEFEKDQFPDVNA
jgi:predicted DNA-binding protein